VIDKLLSTANEKPWMWALYALVVLLPIILVFLFCCGSKSKPDAAETKKSDAATADDDKKEDDEQEEEEEEEGEADEEADDKPKTKADLEGAKVSIFDACYMYTVCASLTRFVCLKENASPRKRKPARKD
jgi:hypothetical protein